MNIVIIRCDCEEENIHSYKGMYITQDGKEIYRSFSNNPIYDTQEAVDFAFKQNFYPLFSSTIYDFLDELQKHITTPKVPIDNRYYHDLPANPTKLWDERRIFTHIAALNGNSTDPYDLLQITGLVMREMHDEYEAERKRLQQEIALLKGIDLEKEK